MLNKGNGLIIHDNGVIKAAYGFCKAKELKKGGLRCVTRVNVI